MPNVRVDAAKVDRSLLGKAPGKPRQQRVNPVLKFWRWMIQSAIADAKKTRNGMPTDTAILERWWIEDHRPDKSDRDEWERSFDACCSWLGIDPVVERAAALAEIDAAWTQAVNSHMQTVLYVRRAAVLSCAGRARAIGRQHVLPMVHAADYETVADINYGDPIGWEARLLFSDASSVPV